MYQFFKHYYFKHFKHFKLKEKKREKSKLNILAYTISSAKPNFLYFLQSQTCKSLFSK